MLITLFSRAVIYKSDAEVYLTGLIPSEAVSHKFILILKVCFENVICFKCYIIFKLFQMIFLLSVSIRIPV
jgi:hypothetical protein